MSLLDFFNLFDSRLILTLLYDSLNLAINEFISGVLGAWFRINEIESAAEVGLCCTHNALVQHMSRKMQFTCFPVLPGSAEAQVIWGGIVKRRLIAYFIGNISAKNIKIRSHVSKLWKGKHFCRHGVYMPVPYISNNTRNNNNKDSNVNWSI